MFEFQAILKTFKVPGILSLLAALGVGLYACSSVPETSSGYGYEVRPKSSYGSYLAGRYASSIRETDQASEFFQQALARDPESAIILERAFLLEIADGDIDRAIQLANKIILRDAENRIARLVLALDAFTNKNYSLTRTHLSQGRSGPLNAIVSDIITAWTYAAEGDGTQALAALEKGANSSLSVFYVSARGHIQDYLGQRDLAELDLAQSYRLTDGHSLNAVLSYGSILARQGKTDEARRVYKGYLDLAPGHDIVDNAMSRLDAGENVSAFVSSPNRGVALAIYNPASYLAREMAIELPIAYLHMARYVDPGLDSANMLLADLYEKSRRFEEAMAAYSAIPKSSDYYRSARIQYAVNLDRLDRTDEAVRLLKSMVDGLTPDDIDVLTMLGDMLRYRERFEDAIEVYTDAVSLIDTPTADHWGLYYSRGVALEQSKRWPEAERDFLTALDLSPNQPLVLNYLGYSWIEQGMNMEQALELIQSAVSMRPDDGFIVDSLGWAYYKLGQYEMAVRFLVRAVELQPNDPTINEHLGDAYWKVGRRNEARFQWSHALDLEPEPEIEAQIRRKVSEGM